MLPSDWLKEIALMVTMIAWRVLALVACVSAAAVELTDDNFDAEVFDSGKSAFVKFLAPW